MTAGRGTLRWLLLTTALCGLIAAAEADSTSSSKSEDVFDDLAGGLAGGLAAASSQALAAAAAANSGLGPVLCNTLDCPSYKVLERYEDTELRRYDPATFTSTVLSLDDLGSIEKAAIVGFHRLLKYNLGDNEDEKKLPMTAPVLYGLDIDDKESSRREVSFKDRFSVSFFVPFKYQDEPPSPRSPEVFLVDVEEIDIFVRPFGGYATGGRIRREATNFLRDLYDDGHRIDDRTVYIAQYSPPFQPVFRYNEVWVIRHRKRSAAEEPSWLDPKAGVNQQQQLQEEEDQAQVRRQQDEQPEQDEQREGGGGRWVVPPGLAARRTSTLVTRSIRTGVAGSDRGPA